MLRNAVLLLCILIVLLAIYFLIREIRRKLQGRCCSGCIGCDYCGSRSEAEAESRETALEESQNESL